MSFEGFDDLSDKTGPDEVGLPAKLTALAEQLSDDADSLALRYPAADQGGRAAFEVAIAEALSAGRAGETQSDAERVVRSPADTEADGSGTMWRWPIISGVCAAMVLVVVASWTGVFPGRERADQFPAAAAHLPAPADQPRYEQDIGNVSDEASLSRDAMLLRGLSTAEQEAVLDLLEDGPERSVSLSI